MKANGNKDDQVEEIANILTNFFSDKQSNQLKNKTNEVSMKNNSELS